MITESEILKLIELLDTNPRVVELCMVVLHDRTPPTLEDRERRDSLGGPIRGFCMYYQKLGERLARRVWEGRSLTGDDLKMAREVANFHLPQLIESLKASHFLGF